MSDPVAKPESNRQWILVARPEGLVGPECFEWRETEVPKPEEGEILVRNLWLSFDPTQRGWMSMDTYIPKIPLGEPMRAAAVSRVLESRHPDFAPGDLVQGLFGWEDCSTGRPGGLWPTQKLPEGVPPEAALGLLGITGLTAYFGVRDVGAVKPGETFVVSGAAGATGSVAGQVAKAEGGRVVGIAGGERKCRWCVESAGFDACIDYKGEDVAARLGELCPDGVDVYFDNVGGPILEAVMDRLAIGARIVVCGAISQYNDIESARGPANYLNLILRRARMEGFLVLDYAERFPEAMKQLSAWHAEGKVRQELDVAEGLEKAPETLQRLFTGGNLGKQVLRIAEG